MGALRFLPIILPTATAMQVDVLSLTDIDACKCLVWTEVYGHELSCGDGCEFYHDLHHCCPQGGERETVFKTKGMKLCQNGLMKLTTNTCVNKDATTPGSGQWCYVSSKCMKANKIHNKA